MYSRKYSSKALMECRSSGCYLLKPKNCLTYLTIVPAPRESFTLMDILLKFYFKHNIIFFCLLTLHLGIYVFLYDFFSFLKFH